MMTKGESNLKEARGTKLGGKFANDDPICRVFGPHGEVVAVASSVCLLGYVPHSVISHSISLSYGTRSIVCRSHASQRQRQSQRRVTQAVQ